MCGQIHSIKFRIQVLHYPHYICMYSAFQVAYRGVVGCSSLSKACLPLYLWNCPYSLNLYSTKTLCMYACLQKPNARRTFHLLKKAKYIQAKPTTRLYHTRTHTVLGQLQQGGTKRTKWGAAGHAAKGHGRRPARKGR